jgi:dienelactone hydrolase
MKISRRTGKRHVAVAALTLTVLLAACDGGSSNGATRTVGSGAGQPKPPFAVGSTTVILVDPARGTAAWGDVPAASSRTIETLVLYPARGKQAGVSAADAPPAATGRLPVVVFLHGASTTAQDYQTAVEPWAEAGYIVVAPTAPLGGLGLQQSGAARATDVANHPADVRFVLAELPDAIDPAIRAIIDFDRVAVVGKSLGATTAMAVAFDPCCTDDSIRGVVAMAGPPSLLVGAGTRVPMLVVHGDADEIVSYSSGRANFDAAPEPKFLLTLLGTTHAATLAVEPAGPADDAVAATTIDFFDRYLKSDEAALDRLSRHGTVPGVARLESSPKTNS